MTSEVFTYALALIAQPEAKINFQAAQEITAHVVRVEKKYQLPPMLLLAVVLIESGGRKNIVGYGRPRGRNGCDVGAAQIHVRECNKERMRRMLLLSANLDEAGRLLAGSRSKCGKHPSWRPCWRGKWSLYNADSEGWPRRLDDAWERLRRWHGPNI